MAVDRVIANSRNSRPTIPPISSSGINTAISEMLMDRTVKPISFAPCRVAAKGSMPVFEMPRDVFHDYDGVIHHEARGDGQGHQRQIVQAVAAEVHHRERADQRNRNGDCGNQRGAPIAQER